MLVYWPFSSITLEDKQIVCTDKSSQKNKSSDVQMGQTKFFDEQIIWYLSVWKDNFSKTICPPRWRSRKQYNKNSHQMVKCQMIFPSGKFSRPLVWKWPLNLPAFKNKNYMACITVNFHGKDLYGRILNRKEPIGWSNLTTLPCNKWYITEWLEKSLHACAPMYGIIPGNVLLNCKASDAKPTTSPSGIIPWGW